MQSKGCVERLGLAEVLWDVEGRNLNLKALGIRKMQIFLSFIEAYSLFFKKNLKSYEKGNKW